MKMTIAYWCVLAAILLPMVWALIAKFSSGFAPKDNHNPREFLAKAEGVGKRANWAQMNTFESIPGFMAAVIIAQQLNAPQGQVDAIAVTYIVLRLIYGALYIADKASLRSLVWGGGLACIIALFVIAA
jgi:uncharacterized MAPEG superfamily protein